uniref:Uncharacterized protein n=1 Tax=Rhizophora mucronata TaxID=61149 RepID=A0A2P2QQ76_RHIMU
MRMQTLAFRKIFKKECQDCGEEFKFAI